MANMSGIRSRLQSVKQTRQITNAMYLVSTSRMRKAMRGIEQNKEYFAHALASMRDIRARTKLTHPYLTHREGNRVALVVIAGEKGLSGSYNHDVLALADKVVDAHNVTQLFTVGNAAATHFRRKGREVNERFMHIGEDPSITTSRKLVAVIRELYDGNEIDEMRIVYTRFVNSMVHEPADVQMLPIELDCFPGIENHKPMDEQVLYEPSAVEVFYALVPQFIIGYVYGALVNAYASENYARMTAMESATNSADKMIRSLTQDYHAQRQLSITNEISEIVAGATRLR